MLMEHGAVNANKRCAEKELKRGRGLLRSAELDKNECRSMHEHTV